VTDISANYYDGKTSARKVVSVRFTVPGYLSVQELGSLTRYRLADLEIPEQLGSQPARVALPDGGLLEIPDSDAFYAQLRGTSGRNQWLHTLESRWTYAVLALLATLLFAWSAYVWGIPELARRVAWAIPIEVDQQIGKEGLGLLDAQVFSPSELDLMRQLELLAVFISVVETVGEADDYRYELVFRKGNGMGANALALPAGTIVITDELVALSEHDEELAAIMAHEVGHVRNRHALRMLLQNSVVAGLIITLTGDVASATSLAAGIPTVLARAGYSRDFEYDADAVAMEYLIAADIPLARFADILLRMNEEKPTDSGVLSLLDTHPDSRDRARAFQ
jgi:Zn-dependent protease with chaperone function